jgi:hypothetical protein
VVKIACNPSRGRKGEIGRQRFDEMKNESLGKAVHLRRLNSCFGKILREAIMREGGDPIFAELGWGCALPRLIRSGG